MTCMTTNPETLTPTTTVTVGFLERLVAFMDANNRGIPGRGTTPVWWDQPNADAAIEGERLGLVSHRSATQIDWTEAGVAAVRQAHALTIEVGL